jgi:hypothetical protein
MLTVCNARKAVSWFTTNVAAGATGEYAVRPDVGELWLITFAGARWEIGSTGSWVKIILKTPYFEHELASASGGTAECSFKGLLHLDRENYIIIRGYNGGTAPDNLLHSVLGEKRKWTTGDTVQ